MNNEEIIKLYLEGFSIAKLASLTKKGKETISKILGSNIRSRVESRKIYLQNNKIIVSEKTRDKLRAKRLEWIKNNPEKTAWRNYKESHIEKIVKDFFIKNDWVNKYLIIQEKSVDKYFIDFAFDNEMVALELDGNQHNNPDRKQKDIERDAKLNSLGWVVYRIPAINLIKDLENEMDKFKKYLNLKNKNNVKVGMFKYKSKYIKTNRPSKKGIYRTIKEKENSFRQRKVINRPSLKSLEYDVKKFGFSATGRKYNVSGNCIKKWINYYKMLGNAM